MTMHKTDRYNQSATFATFFVTIVQVPRVFIMRRLITEGLYSRRPVSFVWRTYNVGTYKGTSINQGLGFTFGK